jgi:hypothetical protein
MTRKARARAERLLHFYPLMYALHDRSNDLKIRGRDAEKKSAHDFVLLSNFPNLSPKLSLPLLFFALPQKIFCPFAFCQVE